MQRFFFFSLILNFFSVEHTFFLDGKWVKIKWFEAIYEKWKRLRTKRARKFQFIEIWFSVEKVWLHFHCDYTVNELVKSKIRKSRHQNGDTMSSNEQTTKIFVFFSSNFQLWKSWGVECLLLFFELRTSGQRQLLFSSVVWAAVAIIITWFFLHSNKYIYKVHFHLAFGYF